VPVLIAMCGLPFSGKSVLAGALSRELRIRVLSYDAELYPVHSRRAPAGSSVAAEYDFVQAIARREIAAVLAGGESLIYDDLLLGREDRRKLAAVTQAHWADLVLVYLDTPPSVIEERRAANSRTRARTSVPEGNMRADISLLEPPEDAERAIYVSPDYVLPEVLAKVSARVKGTGRR
jgi:predicted kinase